MSPHRIAYLRLLRRPYTLLYVRRSVGRLVLCRFVDILGPFQFILNCLILLEIEWREVSYCLLYLFRISCIRACVICYIVTDSNDFKLNWRWQPCRNMVENGMNMLIFKFVDIRWFEMLRQFLKREIFYVLIRWPNIILVLIDEARK